MGFHRDEGAVAIVRRRERKRVARYTHTASVRAEREREMHA